MIRGLAIGFLVTVALMFAVAFGVRWAAILYGIILACVSVAAIAIMAYIAIRGEDAFK
jgi:hypothetical protein